MHFIVLFLQNIYVYKKKIKNQNAVIFWLAVGFFAILLLILALTTAYFSNQKSSSGQITLGELDFTIYENQNTFENVMPSQNIAKTVSIVNARNSSGTNYQNLCPIFFKFYVVVYVDNEIDTNLTNLIKPSFNSVQTYTQSGEEFYYNNVLYSGQAVNLCDGIKFSQLIDNKYQDKTINFEFCVSAIQSQNNAYLELWPEAPADWVQKIENI